MHIFTSVSPTGATAKNLFSTVLSAGINKRQVSKWRKFYYIIHATNTSRILDEKMANAENRSEYIQFYEGNTTGESARAPYYRSNAKNRLLWLGRVQKLKFRQEFQLPSLGLFSEGIGQPLLDLAAVGVRVKTIVPPHFQTPHAAGPPEILTHSPSRQKLQNPSKH